MANLNRLFNHLLRRLLLLQGDQGSHNGDSQPATMLMDCRKYWEDLYDIPVDLT